MPAYPAALGPGPLAFLQSAPARYRSGAFPQGGTDPVTSARLALRDAVRNLFRVDPGNPSAPTAPAAQAGVAPEFGGGISGASTAGPPGFESNIYGYDPGLVALGLRSATQFAPGPISLAALAAAKGLQFAGGGNLATTTGQPASYIGPTTPMGLARAALGFGPSANLPSFVTATDPFSLQGTEFALANAAPQTSLGFGFGPGGVGYGGFGSTVGPPGLGAPDANLGYVAANPAGAGTVAAPPGGYFNSLGQISNANLSGQIAPEANFFGAVVGGLGNTGVPGVGEGVPGGPAASPGGGAPGGPGGAGPGGGPGGAASGTAADVGGAGGGGGDGGSTVICTELHRCGALTGPLWEADRDFGRQVDPRVLYGYLRWAPTVVRWMRRSRLVFAVVKALALPWAHEMGRQMGVPGEQGSRLGRLMMAVGMPVCRMLGQRRVPCAA